MKKMTTRLLAAAALCIAPTAANAAVTLTIENGKLTGATGVMVEGKSYDVKFVEGNCASVYGACQNSSFDFTTQASAEAAGLALLNQVLLDGPSGNFDSDSSLTFGCTSSSGCGSFITFQTVFAGSTITTIVGNGATDIVSSSIVGSFADTTTQPSNNYVRFTLSAAATPSVTAVPEPATWAMMILGFGLTGAALRRRVVRTTCSFA